MKDSKERALELVGKLNEKITKNHANLFPNLSKECLKIIVYEILLELQDIYLAADFNKESAKFLLNLSKKYVDIYSELEKL